MSFASSLAGMATSALDKLVGGQLTKASLTVWMDDTRAELVGTKLEFQFNPETIVINRTSPTQQVETHGTTSKNADQQSSAVETVLNLGNIVFDTYEEKPFVSVYTKYIATLEKFISFDPSKHAAPWLEFQWGTFTKERANLYGMLICKLQNFNATYTLFNNDGMPVRAKVNLSLNMGLPPELQLAKKSPDHAKLVVVRRGQTLTDIAADEYDNPREWRRIADANNIDDPLHLRPGSTLLVPPILS